MALTAKFTADFTSFYSAVEKAETVLVDLSKGANKVDASLKKMVDDFSGRKLIQQATLMAESVNAVGGASKLTDAELKRVAATTNEAAEKMTRLGMEVPKAFKDIADAAKRIKEPVEDSINKPMGELTTRVVAFGSAVGTFIGRMAYDAVLGLSKATLDLATNGIKLAPVVAAFEKLTDSIGEAGDEMLRVTRGATKGLITDLDIMAAANKAMLLGLPVTSKEMGVLGSAAVALGKAMKQDAAKSLDDLITALGRSSPLILDNLGLTVKVGEANELYAQQVGKSASSLTDAEKKLAFYNAAMAAAKEKVEALGGVQLTLADQVLRVKNQFTNFTDALGVAIARSPALEALFGSLADSMETAFGGNQVTRVQELVKWVNEIAISAVGVGQSFIELTKIGTGTWTFLKDGVLGLLEAQFRVRAGLRDLIPIQKYKEEANILRAMADSLRDQADESNAKQRQLEKTLDAASAAAGRMQARMREAAQAQASSAAIAAELTRNLDTQSKATDASGQAADKAAERQKKFQESVTVFRQTVLTTIPALDTYGKHLQDVQGTLVNYEAVLFRATSSTDAFGRVTYTQGVPSLGEIGSAAHQAALRVGELDEKVSGLGAVLKNSLGGIGTVLKNSIGGLSDIFQRAFEGGGGVGGAVKSFATNLTKGLLEMIPVVGKVIGQFAGPIVEGFSKLFGNLFGNKTKDAILESFGSFDELRGKLGALGAEGERMWIRLTQNTGRNDLASTKAQIDEINKALAEHEAQIQKTQEVLAAAQEQYAGIQERLAGLVAISPEVQAALDAAMNAETAEEYKAALDAVNAALDKQGQDAKFLEETMKKYKIEWTSLGEEARKAKVAETTRDIQKEFDVLLKAGVDVNEIMRKMGPSINDFVKQAKESGTEIPESFRRIIQVAMDAGEIFDENGVAIKDMAKLGVTFGTSMEENMKKATDGMTTAILKLIDLLEQKLGPAIKNIPDGDFTIKGKYEPPKVPRGEPGPELPPEVVPQASGGMGRVTKPTLFLAGEAGPEDFAFSGANKKFGGGGTDLSALERKFDAMRDELMRQRQTMPKQIRDAILFATA